MHWVLDVERDVIPTLHESAPGMWRTRTDQCGIYRVPHRLRRVNPEAYTPQLLLLGPLHHSLRSQTLDITNSKSMGYLNMEEHKKIYLAEFAQRSENQRIIDSLRDTIKENEEIIRESYSESTLWIKSTKFVDIILHDSVFIVEFLLRSTANAYYKRSREEKTWDPIVDEPCLQASVFEDLILLENQLPYFILEELFGPLVPNIRPTQTFRHLVLSYFGFQGKIKDETKFIHFTDLLRCVRVETLEPEKPANTRFRYFTDLFQSACVVSRKSRNDTKIRHMYNAEKLYSAGVEFVAVKDEFSIDVTFQNGYLKIPCLWVRDDLESILRNIMALEQCHYPFKTYVCNFVSFLDFLIDSNKDVDLLIEKGIINNWIGEQSSVAKMVNKLFLGVVENQSYYSNIAFKVNAYYENPINRSRAVLGRVYFGNLWTGTTTVAAMFLLAMTLMQTVASIIQVMQN